MLWLKEGVQYCVVKLYGSKLKTSSRYRDTEDDSRFCWIFFRIEIISVESLIISYLVIVILCFDCILLLFEQFKSDRENIMSNRYFKWKSGSLKLRPMLPAGFLFSIFRFSDFADYMF